ncbi:MAG: molecular chaperone HtpG, partial [Chitinophagaceae bacterium]
RSYLQGDPNVKKINAHITKKVADKLEEIFNKDRKAFEEKWDSLGLFVKYGMMTDDKFLEKANKFYVWETTDGAFKTMDEYRTEAEVLQKNKDGKLVVLYTTNPVQQDAYVQQAIARGYKVVKMETIVDAAFINNMELKWENVQFTRVDADITDNLIDKGEDAESVLSAEDTEKLKSLFNFQKEGLNVNVEVKGLSADAPPVVATRPELMRRMKDMAAAGGSMASWYANMPDEVSLTVNGNHSIYRDILSRESEEMREKMVKNLADLALLSQGLLSGNSLTSFINRSVELMEDKSEVKAD